MKKLIFTFTLWGAMMLLALNAVAQTERFCIAKEGKSATILVDEDDWKGVIRAANDLGDDVRKVTGVASRVDMMSKADVTTPSSILVGTIGKSRIIDRLIKQKKIDVKKVRGQWESYLIDVVDGNLVIAGNHRGTYGERPTIERLL